MNTIKKLEIFGFKSFSNRRELDFPPGLSVIMGPNGSGKSNVAESICFVFGKSSRKELRAEKLGDLVYNGGKKLPPSKLAKVTILIDNKDKRFPLPEDEIKIIRMVDPAGHSLFRVNGKRQPKEYVKSMLSQGGVDPDGYNIVMQGEIEHFIDLSTEERRKIIEDLSGVSIYEEKKHKCLLELERVHQRINEARLVLVEKTKHMEELKKEKEQAEEFVTLRDSLHFKKGARIKREHDEIAKEKEILMKKTSAEEEKISGLTEKKKKLLADTEELRKTVEQISKELETKGETEQTELSKSIEELKIKLGELNAEIKSGEGEIKRIEERIASINNDIAANEKKIKEFGASQQQFNSNVAALETSLKTIQEKYDKLANLDKERMEINAKIAAFETEKIRLSEKVNEFDARINEQKNIDSYKKELEKNQVELGKKLSTDSELAGQIGDIVEKRNALLKQLHLLEGKKSAMMGQLERGVAAILAAKHKGTIKGIHGIISELGKANDKYSIPIAVAAGNRVKSIVVEDVEVAKGCIEYLRQNKLGIATFIPLDKMERAPEKMRELKGADIVDYAFNLVKFNKKYEGAFWYVFGDTLIIKDIDSAKKIGFNKFRMVTLEGDLIEKSGAMVGGHRIREKTGFKDSVEEEMEKLNDEINGIASSVSVLESKRVGLEEEIVGLRSRRHFLESQVKEIKIDYDAYEKLKKTLSEKESEIKRLGSELSGLPKKVDEAELEKLASQIKTKTAEMNELSAKTHGKSFEIQVLQADIKKALGIKKEVEKEKGTFLKNLESNQNLLGQTTKNLEKRIEEEKRFQGKLRELFERRTKLNEKVNENEIKKAQMEETISGLNTALQEIRLKMAEVNARLEGKIAALAEYSDLKLGEIKESVEELTKTILSLEHSIENYGAVNLRALDVYKEVEKEFNELKEKSDKLAAEREAVLGALNMVEENKREAFLKSFAEVAGNFERVFAMLSTNGEGKLILENPESPFEGGVDIIARPGGKKMISLRAMSGGEKTLTTLAFIFAVQEYSPSPFYIMDEVDAALDKENSERLGVLLAQYSKRSQFIVVSHNDSIISQADNLYGVSMNELGESSIVSMKLGKK